MVEYYLQQVHPQSQSVPEQESSQEHSVWHLSVPQQDPLQLDFCEVYAYRAPDVATMAKAASNIIFFFILFDIKGFCFGPLLNHGPGL